MSSRVCVPRVCIAGGGISGLALAGILANKLGNNVSIDILERAQKGRDEGYGLDIDARGQEALRRCGIEFPQLYWQISRERSDVMKIYHPKTASNGEAMMFTAFKPRLLQRLFPSWFPAQPESNRAALRDLLLEQMASKCDNVSVRHSAPVSSVRLCHEGDEQSVVEGRGENPDAVEVLGLEGELLGEYDLVVDATGVHSVLRSVRVNDPVGKHFGGLYMIHGLIEDPESKCSAEFVRRLGQGTLSVMGRGYSVWFQRFGAASSDHRTAFFYLYWADPSLPSFDEDLLHRAVGIVPSKSRAEGLKKDAASLSMIISWLHEDMGGRFDSVWHEAVDKLDRATVRAVPVHGDETELKSEAELGRLPLICVGDSLRNIGLGGGGNLALEDALEVSEILCKPGAFDETTGRFLPHREGVGMREVEKGMLKRKKEFHAQREKQVKWIRTRPGKQKEKEGEGKEGGEMEKDNENANFEPRLMFKRRLTRWGADLILSLCRGLFWMEEKWMPGGAGSRPAA
uniref:FAD-binding domain-containing protein n=1 Tax=Chromera velia CCMP2878 TaxID=1169474 RepID=A0A0G4HLV1_9ALVE|eukprot:Cvel_28910.t1-p1 / transcript=Cvel_28910.t1 / gene=Cvel_28910 / organism=Chromera_velia_CCMP2878 / gene_product=hypothetical protein / transcript_product=hypothetical protein / location=Cvel_scaffold3867:11178-12716(-) / protein_length=513 / sequence_SO=supercontig / SO=protein_coding / is_pseudo=false